jgi:hypothetical protein
MMLCRLATSRTLPPLASTSASSAAFSCAVRNRRRSDGTEMSTSFKFASFWRPETGSRDQQILRKSLTPLHGEGRTLTHKRWVVPVISCGPFPACVRFRV